MSLDGLRAWIGEVERKLGKRTRVFLALSVIAIGIGGAAIYLAIDARESSVSESDVQELQEQLEARIDEVAAAAPASPQESVKPEPEPAPAPEPEPEPRPAPKPKSGDGDKGASTGGADTGGAGSGEIEELLERAKEQDAQGVGEQDGR